MQTHPKNLDKFQTSQIHENSYPGGGGGLAWSTYNFNFNLRKKWLLRENKVVGGAAPPLPMLRAWKVTSDYLCFLI